MTRRRLRAYAFDPSLSIKLETWRMNQVTLSVPWEPLGIWDGKRLIPGPVGDYVEIVDEDPATGMAYPAVNLDDPELLATDGLPASEIDPRFHQQMVYAVVMSTITHFERALGRTSLWAPRWVAIKTDRGKVEWRPEYVHRLRIYPHAMREANAYYSPDKKALLFGYFKANDHQTGAIMPGSTVFTCLSHDVIAHETTHALLDGLHPYFTEASNPDVLAFHEAFADIVSLFSRFSIPEIVRAEIARSRGRMSDADLLGSLAMQFGSAIGSRDALRTYIGVEPDPGKIRGTFQPHARGAILVAAVFDAFLGIYRSRTADLVRLASGGTGMLPAGDIHPDLVERLTQEACKAARHVLTMCIRALDYCPPVDLTFGEYLRALITADADMVPDDDKHYRVAMIEGFRRHGIFPQGVNSMSEEALRWERPKFSRKLEECLDEAIAAVEGTSRSASGRGARGASSDHEYVQAASVPDRLTRRGREWTAMERACAIIRDKLIELLADEDDVQWQLGVCVGRGAHGSVHTTDSKGRPSFQVNRLRRSRRLGPGGLEVGDYVLEITQKRDGYFDPARQAKADKKGARPSQVRPESGRDFLFRGGCTLNIDMRSRRVRYCVAKNVLSEQRLQRQREFIGGTEPRLGIYSRIPDRETFAMLHRC
ncbi:MAG TPA: hypothetical protein PKU91_01980 [Phycisphaerales bacterium]|nr:hypothetical protein [Phycisphaerae bacterium]HRJ49271.1 hypothetical protein [Phycisphaerales bacterium]